jgi:hypothetical protein
MRDRLRARRRARYHETAEVRSQEFGAHADDEPAEP